MKAIVASRSVLPLVASLAAIGAVGCRGEKLNGKTPDPVPTAAPTRATGANTDEASPSGNPGSGDSSANAQTTGNDGPTSPSISGVTTTGNGGTVATTTGTARPTTMAGPGNMIPAGSTSINAPAALVTTGASGVTLSSDVDADAVRKCLNLWGTHPFKSVSAANYKKLSPNVAVNLGGFGLELGAINENTATAEPQLVVIDVAVNYASTTTWKLMNPKGWYCVKGAVATGSDTVQALTNINLACTAKLAKSNLALSLDSNTGNLAVGTGVDQGAQLGILIDASVKLSRLQPNGAACL